MLKYLIIIIILSLLVPSGLSAQTVTDSTATATPQVRNRLQLLNNLDALGLHFNRIYHRLQALIGRLKKINLRLQKRLAKLELKSGDLSLLTAQYTPLSTTPDQS